MLYKTFKPLKESCGHNFAIMKDDDYSQNIDYQAKAHNLEKQIDQMVYKLYGLTPEEIAIVKEGVVMEIKHGRSRTSN